MSKVLTEKQINNFTRGLISEANPLTFPENASLDEENFDLEIDGSRSRRLGVDHEEGYNRSDTGLSAAVLATTRQSFHVWDFPDGSTDVVIGVVRVFNRLYFVNLLTANPSGNFLNSGNYVTINTGLENSEIQTTTINGYFIIVSEDLPYPILFSYDKNTDTVSAEELQLFVRDISGVDDELLPNVRPSDLTEKHKYNLMNQGWNERISTTCFGTPTQPSEVVGPYFKNPVFKLATPVGTIGAIQCTKNIIGVFPSNADTWALGKEGAAGADFEKYSPLHLVKNSLDFVQAPRGSYILDIFSRGTFREDHSGATGLLLDKENGCLTTVCSYAGRIFYSGIVSNITEPDRYSPNYGGFIFFSQVATSKEKIQNCYQENDPTSPTISDLLDTDGGTIQIPEITRIVKLVNTRGSLVVFAENGIWEIFGDTKGFVATSFQISKVSSIGINNPNCVVDANGAIIYWASTGIHALVQEPTTGRLISQNLSISTIQSVYNDIPIIAKRNARGFFDEVSNHVRWLYNDSDTYSTTNYINHYNKELSLHLTINAFYIYSISSLAVNSPYICDYIKIPSYSDTVVTDNVYVGNEQVLLTADPVVIDINISSTRNSQYRFLTFDNSWFSISLYKNTDFMDWYTADVVNGTGVDYSSYLVTGYELSGDMMRKKQVPYILFYFRQTEDGFEASGDDLILTNQSGCTVQAQWDWADSADSGKWGTAFTAYRLKHNYIPSSVSDPFNYGTSVVVTKNKLRGSGKALSLKIQSVTGKDMQLLGWATEITGNSKV